MAEIFPDTGIKNKLLSVKNEKPDDDLSR